MGVSVLKQVKLWAGGFDISGETNKLALNVAHKELDCTVFGNVAENVYPGLAKVGLDFEGFATSNGTTAVEDVIAANLGGASVPVSIAPITGAAGEAAYFTSPIFMQYAPGGAVGDLYAFKCAAGGSGKHVIRGTVVEDGTAARITTSAGGTVQTLGAVGATQYLYANLHVLAASGTNPTLDVTLLSGVTNWGTPSTRITFTQKTAIGSQWATPVAGAITDTYWRAAWTISGTDPSFTFVLVVGIK